MKSRVAALLLILSMLFLLCACGDADDMIGLAKTVLAQRDSSREVRDIYVMRYTDRAFLTDEKLERNTGVYSRIPLSGTVVVLEGKDGLYDYELFFFAENGTLALREDALEYQRAKDRAYNKPNPDWLDYENYMSNSELLYYFGGIGTNAERQVSYSRDFGKDKGVPGRMKDDTWYLLSKSQKEAALG